MWDIIIGKGEKAVTTIKVFGIEHDDISENRIMYRVSNVFGDEGLTIYKDTKVGIMLTKLIEKKATKKEFDTLLLTTFFRHAKPNQIMATVQNFKDKAFNDGRRSKIKELQMVLEIW